MSQSINLEESVFAITHPEINKNFGTAFLCHQEGDSSYFLTCAHVVKTVTKGTKRTPLIDGAKIRKIIYKGNDVNDVALLLVDKFEQNNHSHITMPKPLGLLAQNNIENQSAKTYAISQQLKNWQAGELKLNIENKQKIWNDEESTKKADYNHYYLDREGDLEQVADGNSGAPVLDKNNKVIGLLTHKVSEEKSRDAKKGLLYSINNLLNIDEILKHIDIESSLSNNQDKESSFITSNNIPEESNTTPWFYHTIDHDTQINKLIEYDKTRKNKCLFSLLIAKSEDKADSFAKHCYIELSEKQNEADADIENNILTLQLRGYSADSFKENLFNKIHSVVANNVAGFNQASTNSQQIDKSDTIKHKLEQHDFLVILVHVSRDDRSQQKRMDIIIQGAIESLSQMKLLNVKVLTLFVCNKPLPKKHFFFPMEIPEQCISLGELRKLDKEDTDMWLDNLPANFANSLVGNKKQLEDKITANLTQKTFSYKELLKCLQAPATT